MAKKATTVGGKGATRLVSVTLSGVPAFGPRASVTLELEPGITVLVGRNGAGKSAILNGISAMAGFIFRDPTGLLWRRDSGARSATFEVATPTLGQLVYKCTRTLILSRERLAVRWTERLSADERLVWARAGGQVAGQGTTVTVPEELSYLGTAPVSPHATAISELFRSLAIVPSGLPRSSLNDNEQKDLNSFVRIQGAELVSRPRGRLGALVTKLVSWHLAKDEALEELNAVLLRLKLLRTAIKVAEIKGPNGPGSRPPPERFAHVTAERLLDFLDLSDGTLRVIEILATVIGSAPGSITLIEEPETGIHPGMLEAVVEELKAYATDRQIVVATHSADLVSRFRGPALRLVSRVNGVVRVRKVTAGEAKRIKAFLHDGTLGDFVFGGGIEEDEAEGDG
ncbi:MAG: ATP-binding protein [Polyangiaceae bacterium]